MDSETIDNVIIIGSGPAGYTAGLFTSRGLLKPILFEGSYEHGHYSGGQLTTTDEVEDYLGIDLINGYDLTEKYRNHAIKFGLITIPKTIVKLELDNFPYVVIDEDGIRYKTKSIIIATGAKAKKLGLPNEKKFWSHGISACATCDGPLPVYRNKPLVVIGGGDSAVEYAQYLSKFGSVVYLVHRRDTFRASKITLEKMFNNPKVKLIVDSIVLDAHGDKSLERVEIQNLKTGEITFIDCRGLFYAIGHDPATDFLKDSGVGLDNDGYVIVEKGTPITNKSGVFACGDVTDKKYKKAQTAAGMGCAAALEDEHYLQTL